MATPRETRSVSGRPRVAPRIAETTRRQRERQSVVLAQIVARATLLRKQLAFLDSANANANASTSPLTLIELIQASTAVFEKHHIHAPEDAVFHRHLLTLSLDPEPDWKKKIRRFAVKQSSHKANETPFSPYSSSVGSGVKKPRVRTPTVAPAGDFQTPTRRRSDVGTESRRHSKRQAPADRFGDLLASTRPTTPKETELKENQQRNASLPEVAVKPMTPAQKLTSLAMIRLRLNEINTELIIDGEAEADEAEDDDGSTIHSYGSPPPKYEMNADTDSMSISVQSIPPHAYYPAPPTTPIPVDDALSLSEVDLVTPTRHQHFETHEFRRLATTFQQWRELTTFYRLVHENRQRDMRLTQSVLPPIATFALFRWIALALPPQNDRTRSHNVSLAVPTFVVSRGIAAASPPLLRHFTGRLLVWTIHRIFQTWVSWTRAVQTVRLKSLIRKRTRVFEKAVACLHQWRLVTKHRRRVREHQMWVETLHARKRLRKSLERWQYELETRRREGSVIEKHRHRTLRLSMKVWRRWETQRHEARTLGTRRLLSRSLRVWKESIRWSEEEHRQNVVAHSHFTKRVVRICWGVWKAEKTILKAQRLRMVRADRYHSGKTTQRVRTAWRESFGRRKLLALKCARFQKRQNARQLRCILHGISSYAHIKKLHALAVMDASARRDERLLERVWRDWINHGELTQEEDGVRTLQWKTHRTRQVWVMWRRRASLKRLCFTAKACINSSMIQYTLIKWKTWAEKKRRHRSLVNEWRREREEGLRQRIFQGLQMNVKAGRAKHRAVQSFSSRCSSRRLQIYVWAWRQVAQSQRTDRQKDERLAEEYKRSQLKRCWLTWRQAFHVTRCIQIADIAMARGIRRRCFHQWYQKIQARRVLLQSSQQLCRYLRKRAVRKLLLRVEVNRRHRRISGVLHDRCDDLLMQRGWNAWRSIFHSAKHRHAQVAHAVRQWQHKLVVVYFLEWKAARMRRLKLQSLLSTWHRGAEAKSVRCCWTAWRQYVALKHVMRWSIKDARQYGERQTIKRVLQRWRSRCKQSQEQVVVLQLSIAQWVRNQRRYSFTRWKQCTQSRRLVRAIMARNRDRFVERCFAGWCQWKLQRALVAVENEGRTKQLQQWSMRRTVRKLRHHAAATTRLASLLGLVRLAGSRGLQTAAFRLWILFTRGRRQEKAEAKVCERRMQQFRIRRCVHQWEQFLRLKKMLASMLAQGKEKTRSRLTVRAFRTWRRVVSDRKMRQALTDKALVFQVFRLLPTYFLAWRRSVQGQARKRQLAHQAGRLLYHHREAKAFNAWTHFFHQTKQAKQAIRTWQTQSLLHGFARWRLFQRLQKATARAMLHYQSALRRCILHEWREAAHRQRLLKHFTNVWHAQTTQAYFKQWASHVRMTKGARVLLGRLQNGSLTRVFHAWKAHSVTQRLQCSQLHYRFALLWNRDRTLTSFQRWRALANQQQRLKKRLQERMGRHTSVLFRRWKSRLTTQKQIRARASRVRQRHEKQLVVVFWRRWQQMKEMYDLAHGLRKRRLQQSAEALSRIVFQAWTTRFHNARAVKEMEKKKTKQSLKSIFSRWRDRFVAQRKRQRELVHKIRKHHKGVLLKRVLRRMQARMTIKNTCLRVLLPQLQRHNVAIAWRAWKQYHDRKQLTTALLASFSRCLVDVHLHVYETALASLRRWYALEQGQCFFHWQRVSRHRQWMQKHTVTAMHHWRTRLCATFLRSWGEGIRYRQRKKTLQASGTKHRQSRGWQLWVLYHRKKQRQKYVEAKARRFYRHNVIRKVVATWQSLRSQHRHYRLLDSAMTLHRLQRSLRTWHGCAVHRRATRLQRTVASVMLHHKRIVTAWSQWKQFVTQVQSHRLELQQHTERLQVLILCSTFRAWRAWSQRHTRLGRVIILLSNRCDIKKVHQVFCAWARYATAAKTTRLTVARFAWTVQVRNAIQTLRKHALAQIAKRVRLHKARQWMEILQGRCVTRSFQRWHCCAALSKRKRLAIQSYHMQNLLPRILNAWKHFVQQNHSQNDRLERAVSCWRSVVARRAWHAWAAYQHQRVAIQDGLVTARHHFGSRQRRRVLVAWRNAIVHQKRVGEICRTLLVRWKQQTTYRCLANWHGHVLRRKTHRLHAVIVSSRFAESQLRHAWTEWRLQYIVTRIGIRTQTVRAFAVWHQWWSQRREWTQFQARQTQILLRNVSARYGVHRWRTFVVHAKMAKTMAVLSRRFSNDTLIKRCFEQWLQFLVTRHRDKDKMKRVVLLLRSRHLMSCFQALVRYAQGHSRHKLNLVKAKAHATKQAESKAFLAWKYITSEVQTQRLKLRHYVDLLQHGTQRKSFLAWRKFVGKRVHLRALVTRLLSQRTQLTAQTVLDTWRFFTRKTKHQKTAEAFRRHQLHRHALRQWRRFVVLMRIERMLVAGEQRLIEGCFIAWRKHAVIYKQVRTLGHAKRGRHKRDVLRSHLVAWHSWVHIQTTCASLLASVAMGHHLRFRFLLWRTYTDKKMKLKYLVSGLGSRSPLTKKMDPSNDGTVVGDAQEQPAIRLGQIARSFQRLHVGWEDSFVVWQRWRHVFHASLFYRMRTLYKVFSAWSKWSQRRRFLRSVCSSRATTRRLLRMRTVLWRWREVVVTVQRIQRERRRERELLVIVNAELLRHDRKRIQRHWCAWREHTESKRYLLGSVVSYQRARVLTKFWLLWAHDFVTARRVNHQYHDGHSRQLAVLKARRVIQRLAVHQAWRVRSRGVITTITRRRHNRWCQLCLDQWRRIADTMRRARLLNVFKQRQAVRVAHHAWRVWLNARRLQREAVEAFMHRQRTHTQRAALLTWRAYVDHRRHQADTMNLATTFHLKWCIRQRWRRAVKIQKQTRHTLEQRCAALATWRRRQALARWQTTARNQRLKKKLKTFVEQKHFGRWRRFTQYRVAARFCLHVRHKQAQVLLQQWRRLTQQRLQCKALECQFRAKRAELGQRAVWLAWEASVQRHRNQRIAEGHCSRVLQRKVLHQWYGHSSQASLDRTQRVVVADAFHDFSNKRSAMKRWISLVVQGRQRCAVILTCVIKIQRAYSKKLQQAIFHAWAEAADLERFTRECMGLFRYQRAIRSLHHWRRQIKERQRLQKLQQATVCYRHSRLLSVVFFHWQNYALAWKDAATARANDGPPPLKIAAPPPPPLVSIEPRVEDVESEDEEVLLRFRRPLSPMKKRFDAKTQRRRDGLPVTSPPVLSFADAATLSLDVKKRLLVLGKWKPSHKSLNHIE